MKINTGKGSITLWTLIAIWSVSAVTSLPGLAISPILGELNNIFPKASDLEIQMLTSLPSLLIIPFVLLAGHLSANRNKLALLYTGLTIFFLSGVACLIAKSMTWLIIISCILGIGAGMIVPLSTGLVVDYFTGDYRVRQLGYSSAINNLTLVAATSLTGYFADINWHYSFFVYLLPGISLLLALRLRNTPSAPEPKESDQYKQSQINIRHLVMLTLFYFLITYTVLVVTFDTSFLIERYKVHPDISGVIISLFFLAIMAPGLFLSHIIRRTRSYTNIISLCAVAIGLLCVGLFRNVGMLTLGITLAGLGYGVMQPLIYDKAAIIAPPQLATKALSVVMSANYLAIILCPFILRLLQRIFHSHSLSFPFISSAVVAILILVAAVIGRGNFVLGLDKSYYEQSR
ncbi:MAG: MFS transporter [Alistipes sp.]|nr:MFS transporter [Alistipes sp.]